MEDRTINGYYYGPSHTKQETFEYQHQKEASKGCLLVFQVNWTDAVRSRMLK